MPPSAVALHLAYTARFIGLRAEHFALDLAALALAFTGPRGRRLLVALLPLWLFGVSYDSLRLVPERWRGRVHVQDLYAMEQRLFSVPTPAGRLTLPEWFARHTSTGLDLVCGFAYLTYLWEPLLVIAVLSRRRRGMAARFGWAFLAMNLAAFATYHLFPAAPPWYVARYGPVPPLGLVSPDPAGAARFDQLLGIHYFQGFYSRASDVFGAFPSMHAAYPLLTFLYARKFGPLAAGGSFAFLLAVDLAAVYLQHHWVLDVIAGSVYALVAYGLFEAVPYRRLLERRRKEARGA